MPQVRSEVAAAEMPFALHSPALPSSGALVAPRVHFAAVPLAPELGGTLPCALVAFQARFATMAMARGGQHWILQVVGPHATQPGELSKAMLAAARPVAAS